jgi:hypothetical protein
MFEVEDLDAAVELCFRERWTDGLPVTPATEPAVRRMIDYLGRDPDEVLGIVAPRRGIATLEKVVVNCVMAGCLPEYVPIVIAALEAILDPSFNLEGVQTTTNPCAPLVMVSGPAVRRLGFNTQDCALGHGSRANASIGRAIRLILWNIGGGYPGSPCRTTHGHPGYYSYCIAEDPDNNPWEPLHVTRGFAAQDTVVTVTAVDAPHATATGALVSPAEQVLINIADAIARLGSNNQFGGHMVLVFGPMAAKCLAESGLDKAGVARQLMRLAVRPAADMLRNRYVEHMPAPELERLRALPADAPFHFIRDIDSIVMLTTGSRGAVGSYAAVCPGWGHFGGLTQSRRVRFPGEER